MVSAPDLTLNPRVASMLPSATLAMSAKAKQLKREGRPIISLSAGEPDFDTPEPISQAGIKAIQEGHTKYTENAGLLELRNLICEKLQRDNGLSYKPDQILCSNGAKQSVALAVEALCRPEDEVLIPAPYWVSYPEMVRLAGATPVIIPTTVETNYKLSAAALEAAITPNTRLFILNSPSNPTGAAYNRAELEEIAAVLARNEHVFVLSDEIYEYILFEGEHVSIASLPGMLERTVTVNGFSKGYSMTGWRLGYMAGPKWIVKACDDIQSQTTSAPSTPTQKAGIAALEMGFEPVNEMRDAFHKRRDYVLERLAAIEGIRCPVPEGAFYVFPEVSAYFGRTSSDGYSVNSADDMSMYLLEKCNIATVAGEGFGDPNGIRLSYAVSMEDLTEAMNRMEAGLKDLT